ncbi:MAG TPA: hypothetical protein VGC31_02555 [Paenirhodobacter sp.]
MDEPMTAAPRRFRGRPTEFDLFEGYVTYKIAPFLDGRREEITALAGTDTPDLARIAEDLIALGRECALTGALSLAAAVNRALIGEDSDIVYADACLAAYFTLTDPFKAARSTRIVLSTHFRRVFGQDIDYLILSPEREILHMKRIAWPAMVQVRDATPASQDADFYAQLLGRISTERLSPNWHPYDDPVRCGALRREAQAFYDENLDGQRDRHLPKLSYWIATVRDVQSVLRDKGIAFWAD